MNIPRYPSNGQSIRVQVSSFQHGLDFESPAFPLILRDVSCQRRDMAMAMAMDAWMCWVYPLVMWKIAIENGHLAIEIVDFPMKHGDFP